MKQMPKELILASKYLKDGEVTCFRGVDLIKAGKDFLPISSILSWEHLEDFMKTLPQETLEINHVFSGGVYIREMHIPKGIFIIGKRHRHETCNVLLKGTLSVCIDNGSRGPVNKVTGPLVLTSQPMVRKIAYCHEDSVFLNIHPTQKTNLDDIEKEFIMSEPEFKALQGGIPCLGEQ